MSTNEKVRWSVAVVLVPVIVYLVIIMAGGLVGLVELAVLGGIWAVGLTALWWPRGSHD